MPRKSGIGKQPGDDFGRSKKIPEVDSYRQSNRWSFRVPKDPNDLTNLNDACGFNEINPADNLLEARGRQMGESVEYDPVQIQNYRSQFARYEKAIGLTIDRIYQNAKGRTVYAFCSKDSPTGFWEVTQAGGTFLNIPKPVLLVICPRPFQLQDLTGVITTDGDTFRWTQLQGRTTSIFPNTGGVEALNPTIFTFGAPGAYDPPIQLLIELEDNPQVFRIVQITTVPTSDQYGTGFTPLGNGVAPCYKVRTITPAPARAEGGALYTGGAIAFTWNLPTCDTNSVLQTVWESNLTGTYLPVAAYPVSANRLFVAQPNVRYSIRSDFDTGLRQYSTTSDRFLWSYSPGVLNTDKVILADTTQQGISFASTKSLTTQYQLSVITQQPTDTFPNAISFSRGKANFTQYPLSVITQQPTDTFPSAVSFSKGRASFIKYQLSGVIIG
jgi:hypothetical protein